MKIALMRPQGTVPKNNAFVQCSAPWKRPVQGLSTKSVTDGGMLCVEELEIVGLL